MDYTMEIASIKGKKHLKLTIEPMDSLEREFFNNLFTSGMAIINTVPNSEEIEITIKDDKPKPLEQIPSMGD